MAKQLEAATEIVSDGLIAPLAFSDVTAATAVLLPLYNTDDVVSVAFFRENGELFLALPEGRHPESPPGILDEAAGSRVREDLLVVHRPVYSSGKKVGVLYLEADRASLDEQAFQILKVTGASLLGGLLLAIVIATILVRRMTAGLLNLTQTAREVSVTRDYSLRASALDEDEIGTLVQAFNDMLHVVQTRTEELQVAQAELRERISQGEKDQATLEEQAGETNRVNTRLRQEIQKREETEAQLRLAQRLEAVGQLAAGVAHEINTPIQYLTDNTTFLGRCFEGLTRVIEQLRGLLASVQAGSVEEKQLQEVEEALRTSKIDYLVKEAPAAVEQSLEGLSRVSAIIQSMGEFAHPGDSSKSPVDINHLVENTVTLSRSQWRYVAVLRTELDDNLPLVYCNRDTIGQTLVNLVVNATHAIGEPQRHQAEVKGEIVIQTMRDDDWAEIRINDNGPGIPEELKTRIFDPFFTTKEVGQGTGQGLALAWSYVVNEHRGTISVESTPGHGASFRLRLPIKPQVLEQEE